MDHKHFGELLRRAREVAGLNRAALAQLVGTDASYISRIEAGKRRPSQKVVLALAEAIGTGEAATNKWLLMAGHAPVLMPARGRAAVRTRGGSALADAASAQALTDAARWGLALQDLGLQEGMINRLARAFDAAGPAARKEMAAAISAALTRTAEALEVQVRTALIPVAGSQHRALAPHTMQRLLLRAISELVESGVVRIVLILAPGTVEQLYAPLHEALSIAPVPPISLRFVEQNSPGGLGDAVLRAEALVGSEPFVVLLPDDVIRERGVGNTYHRELRRMIETFRQLDSSYLLSVAAVPRAKMPRHGVAEVSAAEVRPNVLPITRLAEKPSADDAILRSPNSLAVVGRYLLSPGVFKPLRELKRAGSRPLQLTAALEQLRRAGQNVYAFKLKAERQDVGELMGQASELFADP